jgi:prolyl oligopeptidase
MKRKIYFHKLGTPAEQDAYELGKEFPAGVQIELQSSPDARQILASIADSNRPRFAHFLREPSGRWRQITRFEDNIIRAEFGRDPLYIDIRSKARRSWKLATTSVRASGKRNARIEPLFKSCAVTSNYRYT